MRSDRTISPNTARAMASAQAAGIEVVWATARARHSVHEFAQASGFRGKAICANGAVILDLADGTPTIDAVWPISLPDAADAIDAVRRLVPGITFATVGPTRFIAESQYAALSVFSDHHRDPATMATSGPLGEDVVKIVARHPTVPAPDVFSILAAAGVPRVELTHSGAPYVEMSAEGINKAWALQMLALRSALNRRQIAAAGDARNDLDMLRYAGTAVCPSNAIPDVIAVCTRVLPSNDEEGVAGYLDELTHHARGELG
ncbi:hydrolase [Rhodococcoides trifolii]|uniref:Hydrolase n=1 Tax=Rhodococcoides trifolii TaxID=908250 RepID=A0A917CTH8_9NOCA|nr:hydrolase [Rhodococcus trifolii]